MLISVKMNTLRAEVILRLFLFLGLIISGIKNAGYWVISLWYEGYPSFFFIYYKKERNYYELFIAGGECL
jgi:hypothetical protein